MNAKMQARKFSCLYVYSLVYYIYATLFYLITRVIIQFNTCEIEMSVKFAPPLMLNHFIHTTGQYVCELSFII